MTKTKQPVVSLGRCTRYHEDELYSAINKLLEPLGGLASIIKGGRKVLLKPNMLAAVPAAEAVTTHPLVVRTIARMAYEAGAEVYIGDSPGSGSQEYAHRVSGYQKVMEETGAKMLILQEPKICHAGIDNKRLIPLAAELDQVDLVINLAKLKTHSLTGMTAAVKNIYGCIPGNHKKRLHGEYPLPLDFSRLLIDLCEAVKPALSIIDAVVAMEGVGPRRGKPRQAGLLLASHNPYALDSVAAAICGFRPEEVTTVAVALDYKLPGAEIEEIKIEGGKLEDFRLANFDRGVVSAGRVSKLLLNFPLAWLRNMHYNRRPYPFIDAGLCNSCGECIDNCPLQIIELKQYVPDIDLNQCIRCYCCQELCSRGAIKLTGRSGV